MERSARSLTPIQLDALREVANIGTGHAATALSQMAGVTMMISVPTITIARLADLPARMLDRQEPVIAVLMDMEGDLTGRTLLVLPRAAALRLAEMMLRRPTASTRNLGALEESAVKEAGNILGASYMNALSEFLHLRLLPSPPTLAVDDAHVILSPEYLKFGHQDDFVVCVETDFFMHDVGEHLRGFFLVFPDDASLQTILKAARVA